MGRELATTIEWLEAKIKQNSKLRSIVVCSKALQHGCAECMELLFASENNKVNV
jgi:hypothetical protein